MNKFTVIETGGKQYCVSKDDMVKIEILNKNHNVGDKIVFDKILMVSEGEKLSIGDPYLKNEKIEASIIEVGKDKKINIIKFKSKSNYKRQYGHRQSFIKVKFL